ncbi:hypothetical protein RB653_004792 [Dictyostelium firmibasis]|uniref:Uncharacterized protein n=1 Tax=Dictyostelium firmibasis TaxID=79012 RepID=A0AAN7YXM5_9MYCE
MLSEYSSQIKKLTEEKKMLSKVCTKLIDTINQDLVEIVQNLSKLEANDAIIRKYIIYMKEEPSIYSDDFDGEIKTNASYSKQHDDKNKKKSFLLNNEEDYVDYDDNNNNDNNSNNSLNLTSLNDNNGTNDDGNRN